MVNLKKIKGVSFDNLVDLFKNHGISFSVSERKNIENVPVLFMYEITLQKPFSPKLKDHLIQVFDTRPISEKELDCGLLVKTTYSASYKCDEYAIGGLNGFIRVSGYEILELTDLISPRYESDGNDRCIYDNDR